MLLARNRLGLLLLGALLTVLLYLWLPAARRSRPDEGKRGWRVANGTVRTGMAAGEPPVFYREVPAAAVGPGRWVSPPAGGEWQALGSVFSSPCGRWTLEAFLNPSRLSSPTQARCPVPARPGIHLQDVGGLGHTGTARWRRLPCGRNRSAW